MTREKNSIELLAAMAADPAMHRSMDALSRARKVRDWLIEFALDHMGKLDALQTENARLKSDLVAAGASYSGVIRTMGECREKADQRIAELGAALKKEETDCLNVIAERDCYHEWADQLADAIGRHFVEEIGEHSSANNPWKNALELIENR